MVRVYFETPNHTFAERIATFKTDELYKICVPALEKEAKKHGYILTESVEEEEEDLFQNPEAIPENVKSILDHFGDDLDYENLRAMKLNLETIGYTFDYGLSAEPFNLRKI